MPLPFLFAKKLRVLAVSAALASGCSREESAPNPLPSSAAAAPRPTSVPAPAARAPEPKPFERPLPGPELRDTAPARKYARLGPRQCAALLAERKLPVTPARGKTKGVVTPLRLTGPLHGVRFDTPKKTVYGVIDCRLVLLLDDIARELASARVVAVTVNNIYRPASTLPPKAPRGPLRVSQHALGLAVDIVALELQDGRKLEVERDWHGSLGAPVCGPGSAVAGDDPGGIVLRNVTCAIARGGYCHHLLTPNHDEPHKNHLHCDIKADSKEVEVK